MRITLRITGPNLDREVALDPSGAEVTLGRDPAADVQLPDPQKHISRKHLAVRQGADGLELRVVSDLNGVETSRGPARPGQRSVLVPGDHFTLGPYRVDVVTAASESLGSPATPELGTDDVFAALLGGGAAPARNDDPFARPEFRSQATPPRTGVDTLQQLAGFSSTGGAGPVGPFGDLLGPGKGSDAPSRDTLSDTSMQGAFGQSSSGPRLDDWLSGGTQVEPLSMSAQPAVGPLDTFLGRPGPVVAKALSPDHVHGIHMPMSFGSATGAEAPHATAVPAYPTEDVWANLTKAEDAPAATGQRPEPVLAAGGSSIPTTASPSSENAAAAAGFPVADDPFDDWSDIASPPLRDAASVPGAVVGGAGAPRTAVAAANMPAHPDDAEQTDAWNAFARGLGLPPTHPSDPATAERAGAMVRLLIEGLAELLGARADLKRELRAEDRTMLSGRDNNPLKAKLSASDLVQYLFAAHVGGGYMPAERAVRESVADLRVHEHATIAASRAAVEGALRDFEPGRLRKQLAKGKAGMFQVLDNAKLWESYQQHYEKQAQHMADWLEAVFARHFMPTYARETERLKTEGKGDPPG